VDNMIAHASKGRMPTSLRKSVLSPISCRMVMADAAAVNSVKDRAGLQGSGHFCSAPASLAKFAVLAGVVVKRRRGARAGWSHAGGSVPKLAFWSDGRDRRRGWA